MLNQVKITVFLICLITFQFILVYSQSEEYNFRHITHKDGLSSNYVLCITKDSRGYMWFGTTEGINRYDGYNIKAYKPKPDDSTSISHNTIWTIVEHNNGLLVGTQGGLNVFDFETERFAWHMHNQHDPKSISNNTVKVIKKDSSGLFWVGTENGLNLFDPSTGTFKVFKQDVDLPQSKKNQINEIYRDKNGILWIGTNDGLYQFNRDSFEFKHFDLIPSETSDINGDKKINTIIEDHNGALWVGTDFIIFKIIDGKQEWIGIQSDRSKYPSNYYISDIVKFRNQGVGHFWLSTAWGLNKYNFSTKRFTHIYSNPDNKKSISNNTITSLFYDDNGLLWLATADGVDILKLRKNPFHQHTKSIGNFKTSIISFYEDKEGSFWMGSINAGLLKYDKDLNFVKQYSFMLPNGNYPSSYRVYKIFEDSEQIMWIGMNRPYCGIYTFDKEKETFTKVAFETLDDYPEPTGITAIIEDQNGVFWYGTNAGLFWFNKRSHDSLIMRYSQSEILSRAVINNLYIDHLGNLWLTSPGGLFWLPENCMNSMDFTKFDPDKNEIKSYQGYPYNIIQCKNGSYWLGTSEGLFKFNQESKKFHIVEEENELIGSNKIYSIIEDKHGFFWLITRNGLIRFNPFEDNNANSKLFDISDGLPFEGYLWCDPYLSNDGRIFLPGRGGKQDGFINFHPDSIYYNQHIPPIAITKFIVQNKSFNLAGKNNTNNQIELKYNQNFFSFEFAALDYVDPAKNQYAYYLEGLEDEWIESGNRRFANYTNVPPGDYIFRVKGSNNDGYWNEEGVSLALTILPPPWKTWWAYSLYVLFVIGLFLAWRRYDLKRQRLKQELEIEHVEAEKLKELDTMKSRFFANISHEFRTPLTLILGPLEKLRSKITDTDSEQDLNIMQRNAHRLQNLINQLLSLSKLESGKMKLQASEENIVSLVNGYVQSFESLAKQRQIDLNFKSTEENIQVYVDKDKIEKILYNLLSNAFKFTGEGGRIVVGITPTKENCHFEPSSDGEKSLGSLPPQLADSSPAKAGFGMTGRKEGKESQDGVTISISDTGRGIPPEKLNHIFDRFYQADDSYTRDQEGTGIGLALTKELVEIHYGKIAVESEPGTGTSFKVFLPIGKEHLKPDEIKNETEIAHRIEESYKSIPNLEFSESDVIAPEIPMQDIMEGKEDNPYLLIVDDNADLRTYIRGYLNPEYYTTEARDGEEGFKMATEKIPDLILSDVMMPKMDGNELCRKIKGDNRTSHIPVILLTAKASIEDKLEGLETGADDFLIKPFDPDELLVRINNLIQQRKKLREQFIKEFDISGQMSTEDIASIDRIFLQKAKKTVEDNMSDFDFTIEDFAEKMNLSRVQLHRKLKALINQSASDFLRTIRLNKAAQLIKSNSGNITQIAYEVGFNNLSYFSKCFREQFGKNPSDFG